MYPLPRWLGSLSDLLVALAALAFAAVLVWALVVM